MSPQTIQILIGAFTALLYASAILAVGTLVLGALLGSGSRARIRHRIGLLGFTWLGFVLGQGLISVLWLALSLAGVFHPWPVWVLCSTGGLIAGVTVQVWRAPLLHYGKLFWLYFLSRTQYRSWYLLMAGLMALVSVFLGISALLPTGVDDALRWYLVLPRIVATQHQLELLPFLAPYYGLHPLQVEMHWAALFAISNETAVTVWDYLCAMSSLIGIGILAVTVTSSRRVAAVAILMMLTTPGFYNLVGGGKPDNAAAQYGIAAFLTIILWPESGRRVIVLTGLCAGWSLACRYTNMFLLPALGLLSLKALPWTQRFMSLAGEVVSRRLWLMSVMLAGTAATLAVAPMLFKNWLLLGCPLAPAVGCQDMVWSGIGWAKASSWVYNQRGISLEDLLAYPYVWTFGSRAEMLGNISPLFVGLMPLLFLYWRSPLVRTGMIAGLAGLIPIIMWWAFVNRLFPYTRWILLPLGLFAICLGTAAVVAEQDLRLLRIPRWLIRSALFVLLLFLLFQSRGVVYAIRYVAGVDSRAESYKSKPGFDVAEWLNSSIPVGQRIAFAGWNGYSYFISPAHLMNSESPADFQNLWRYCRCVAPSRWTTDFWNFYADAGFNYAVVGKDALASALAVLPRDLSADVAFLGRNDAVLKIRKH